MSSFTTDTVSHVASSALRAPTASLGHGRISNVYMDKPLPSLASFANQEPCNAEKVVVARRRKPTKIPAATDIEIRRQRNRMHQARFIAKQKTTTARLVSGIHRLQEEIQELRLQRQFVSFAVPLRQTRWAVAVEYFRLFRNGLKDTMPQNGPDNALVPVESQVQRNFLQSTMAPDVASSMGFGVESILQNWRLISICHPDLDVQLTRLEDGPGDSLIAHTKGTFTVTECTLKFAFSHLIDGSEEGKWLASRLYGHKIVVNAYSHLIWDSQKERVVSMLYTGDMLSPILQLLGNLEDVSRVFCGARLNPESNFVVEDYAGTEEYSESK